MQRVDDVAAVLRRLLRGLSLGLGRRSKQALILTLDLSLASVAALLAIRLVGGPDAPEPSTLASTLAVGALLGVGASSAGGMHRMKLDAFAVRGLMPFALVAVAAAAALPLTVQLPGMHALQVAPVFGATFFAAAVGARLVLRELLIWALRGPTRSPVLIWGAGDAGVRLVAALRDDPLVTPAAFLDESPALHGLLLGGLAVHAPTEARSVAARTGAGRVLVALPGASPRRLADIGAALEAQGLQAMAVPSFAELSGQTPPSPGLFAAPAAQLLNRLPLAPDLDAAVPAYRDRSVLVTGAGGSVGGELCRQLLSLRPRRLILLDISEAALYAIDAELLPMAVAQGVPLRAVIGTVTDRTLLRRLMREEGVEVVLHAAACKHVPLVEANPLAGLSTNVLGTHAVALAALSAGVKRFVLISTDKAVRPAGIMGLSKRLAECVVQDAARNSDGPALATVRFGNVLGSSGSVVPRFREQIARGGPVTLTHEEATRYFITLAEAARLVLVAGAMAQPGQAGMFVLDMGAPVRIRDLAERMIASAGLTVRSAAHPTGDIEIVVTGLRPGEKLHEEFLFDGSVQATSHSKILRLCESAAPLALLPSALLSLRAAVGSGDAEAALAAVRVCLAAELDPRAGSQYSTVTQPIRLTA